jgi:hypothetical protein
MWDNRYSGNTYAYGTEPNGFLVPMIDNLPLGNVLCLGEGESRNAVWLARQGRAVSAVDLSSVGLEKAQRLAGAQGVEITTIPVNLSEFDIGTDRWDTTISIFCHLPPDLRRIVHQHCSEGLRPGGVMLHEAFTPRPLGLGTGGPGSVEMMMDAETLRTELSPLEFLHLWEGERDIHEGAFHNGKSAVVQVLARKPE